MSSTEVRTDRSTEMPEVQEIKMRLAGREWG